MKRTLYLLGLLGTFLLFNPLLHAQKDGETRCGADNWVERYEVNSIYPDGHWRSTPTRCSSSPSRRDDRGPKDGETRCGADGWVEKYEVNSTYPDGHWGSTATRCSHGYQLERSRSTRSANPTLIRQPGRFLLASAGMSGPAYYCTGWSRANNTWYFNEILTEISDDDETSVDKGYSRFLLAQYRADLPGGLAVCRRFPDYDAAYRAEKADMNELVKPPYSNGVYTRWRYKEPS